MTRMLGTTLAVALSMMVSAGAQSDTGMARPMKDGTMSHDTMMNVTHTGCVESGAGGALMLTHIDQGQQMSMNGKGMPAQGMKDDHMDHDHMMSPSLRLTGLTGLGKHVGQKVTIKGSHDSAEGMHGDPSAFKVVSLKVVSKSCS